MGDVLEVPGPSGVIEVPGTASNVLELSGGTSDVLETVTTGPQGPPGIPGAAGTVFVQVSPSSTWVIPHSLGRPPVVALFNTSGKRMFADEYPSNDSVTEIFPTPTAGTAVLI